MKQRPFRTLVLIFLVGLISTAFAQKAGKKGSSKPNIVVFLVDDMGWQDTSVPFWKEVTPLNKRFHTPNMERLAREGMKFTNAYAMPICTPTRVSLLTGVNAARTHVTQWTSPDSEKSTDHPDSLFNPVDWNINGFSPKPNVTHAYYATPLPAVLKEAGYYTIHSGKAHFGSKGGPGADPLNVGFDVNIAGSDIGHPASYLGEQNYDSPRAGKPNRNAVPGLEAYHGTDVFLSDAITTEALKSVEVARSSEKPFYLYLAHYAVHLPFDIDKRYIDKYLKMGLDSTEAKYSALVEGMDKSLGDVMDYLDKNDLTKNTVILFMSDNGGLTNPHSRGGQPGTHNLPLKAGKGSVYEGGIREPMIVKWPGRVKPGTATDQPVIVEDFFPTILDIAKVQQPKLIQKVDGQSFYSVLENRSEKKMERELLFHHPNRWVPFEGPKINYSSAFRKGDWKVVYGYAEGKLELYNLKDDIGEHQNLAEKNPEKLKDLAVSFTKKLKDMNAQMPTFKKTGKMVPWPDEL